MFTDFGRLYEMIFASKDFIEGILWQNWLIECLVK